jgi:hypothetical protein
MGISRLLADFVAEVAAERGECLGWAEVHEQFVSHCVVRLISLNCPALGCFLSLRCRPSANL